jgi:alkylhydroperoxidase family enzyme
MRRSAILLGLLVSVSPVTSDAQGPSAVSTVRDVRIRPLPQQDVTAADRALLGLPGTAPAPNDFRTLLVHPALVQGVTPFARYITADSTLPPRHRELLILRTAWLARSDYLWARHATKTASLSREEVARLAAGPPADGWDRFESALIRAADELHRNSFIGDDAWNALSARYDTQNLMDAVFTVAETTMLAGAVNSVGVPVDPEYAQRLPRERAGDRQAAAAGPRGHIPLGTPRIPPLDPAAWPPDVRLLLDPSGTGRPVAAVYRTFAQHPKLYAPRQILSEYIRLKNTLPARIREMLILRIGYLCGSEYEWAAHARAGRAAGLTSDELLRIAAGPDAGWNAADAALLRAVDELYESDAVSGRTWAILAQRFERQQLLDILITTGGYRMVSMALNTFGVPLEPGSERFPRVTAAAIGR